MINKLARLKPIVVTALWKQNAWHKHGVIVHTLRVCYEVAKSGHYRMLAGALLHDIGKPLVAFQKPNDIKRGEYSFTDHEEASYQVIKNWRFVSDYTKEIVRYHYLIRDMDLGLKKNNGRYEPKKAIWDTLTPEMQADLEIFIKCDDAGKGTDFDEVLAKRQAEK